MQQDNNIVGEKISLTQLKGQNIVAVVVHIELGVQHYFTQTNLKHW